MINRPIVEFAPAGTQAPASIPGYKTPGAAGMDIASYVDIDMRPGDREIVRTGWQIKVPEGYECQVRSRSGLALEEGIVVLNSPGTIDSDYTGEIYVLLHNTSNRLVSIAYGQRIAQLVIAPVVQAHIVLREQITAVTQRGDKGFGSTGK